VPPGSRGRGALTRVKTEFSGVPMGASLALESRTHRIDRRAPSATAYCVGCPMYLATRSFVTGVWRSTLSSAVIPSWRTCRYPRASGVPARACGQAQAPQAARAVVKRLLGDVATVLGRLPRHAEPDAAHCGEHPAERLEMVFIVSCAVKDASIVVVMSQRRWRAMKRVISFRPFVCSNIAAIGGGLAPSHGAYGRARQMVPGCLASSSRLSMSVVSARAKARSDHANGERPTYRLVRFSRSKRLAPVTRSKAR
jgi:hypothetical protein